MVPVAEQGASSSTASNGSPGCQLAASAEHEFGLQAEPREVLGSSRSRVVELSTATTRRRRRELRGLAAGRGAEIDHALAGDVAEQPRRQRGGRVLHPPGAVGEAGKLLDAALAAGAAGSRSAARGRRAARPKAPARASRVRSSGGSMRWAAAMAARVASPHRLAQRDHSQSGVLTRAASRLAAIASPSLATRRSTALTSLS